MICWFDNFSELLLFIFIITPFYFVHALQDPHMLSSGQPDSCGLIIPLDFLSKLGDWSDKTDLVVLKIIIEELPEYHAFKVFDYTTILKKNELSFLRYRIKKLLSARTLDI